MTVFGAYSRYYDLLYKDKNYAEEAAYVHRLIQRHRPGAKSLLDLGCGTGRHALLLAEQGYEVTGVDQSAEMLAVARSHPRSTYHLPFHLGDLRTIRLDKNFDVVASLFHVISYLTSNEDLRQAFTTVRAHLRSGGVFIFDCWYGPAVLTDRPMVRVKRMEDEEITVTRIVEPDLRPNDNLVNLNYEVQIRNKANSATETFREIHRMRFLFRPEIELLLSEAGLRVIEISEWMTGQPPGLNTWGVCFVARVMDSDPF